MCIEREQGHRLQLLGAADLQVRGASEELQGTVCVQRIEAADGILDQVEAKHDYSRVAVYENSADTIARIRGEERGPRGTSVSQYASHSRETRPCGQSSCDEERIWAAERRLHVPEQMHGGP